MQQYFFQEVTLDIYKAFSGAMWKYTYKFLKYIYLGPFNKSFELNYRHLFKSLAASYHYYFYNIKVYKYKNISRYIVNYIHQNNIYFVITTINIYKY